MHAEEEEGTDAGSRCFEKELEESPGMCGVASDVEVFEGIPPVKSRDEESQVMDSFAADQGVVIVESAATESNKKKRLALASNADDIQQNRRVVSEATDAQELQTVDSLEENQEAASEGDNARAVNGAVVSTDTNKSAPGNTKRLSSYFSFANENREAVKAELQVAGKPATASAVAKVLGERWRALTDAEKQAFSRQQDRSNKKSSCLLTKGRKPQQAKEMPVAQGEFSVGDGGDGSPDEGDGNLGAEEFTAPFPQSRVKRIIKLDPDIKLVASDGIALITQATALFLESLAAAVFSSMVQSKHKSVRGQHVILAAKSSRRFCDCVGNDIANLLNTSSQLGDESDGEVEADEDGNDGATLAQPHRKKAARKV